MFKASFETIGTKFEITIWDIISELLFNEIIEDVKNICKEFDNKYSRFKPNSFIRKLSEQVGEIDIPKDCLELVDMLEIYQKVNFLTDGQINPLVGNTLADFGYDEKYSLQEKEKIRSTPELGEVLNFKSSPPNPLSFREGEPVPSRPKIILKEKVLIDLGAMGKGYLIDKIYEFLLSEKVEGKNLEKFLVDGSGDIRYFSKNNEEIVCGLEHPVDTTKIIGKLKIISGSLCASSLSRRNWSNNDSTKKYHHYFNPITNNFSEEIIATFVYCPEAKFADILSSALFFSEPEKLLSEFNFEYLIINNNFQLKKSEKFNAELF
jgi:thiamine biosynthesis lipoprotein